MELKDHFARAELLNLPELRGRRPDWTDRLPRPYERPSIAARPYVQWHWSFLIPEPVRDVYVLWLARRRHRRNLEQIEIDELEEVCEVSMVDDSREATGSVYEKHKIRREVSRFHVATRERRRLERLAKRWDVDAPRMIHKGEADEAALAQVRRAVRDARWTFVERCAKTLVPVLSLLVALVALLSK